MVLIFSHYFYLIMNYNKYTLKTACIYTHTNTCGWWIPCQNLPQTKSTVEINLINLTIYDARMGTLVKGRENECLQDCQSSW